MRKWFRWKWNDAPAAAADLEALQADVHSHLIPGIDDGSQSLAESLELIRGLHAMGYRKLVTTPHIYFPQFPNTPDLIREGLAQVQAALLREGIAVEITAAAEYFVDEVFLQLLRSEPLMTFGANYVLVEVGQMHRPLGLSDVVQELRQRGYQPVVAHPERYAWAWQDVDFFRNLHEAGALLQLNLGSFSGAYGPPVQAMAVQLADSGLVQFLGSDTHHQRHIDRLPLAARHPAVRRLIADGQLLNATL